jgi:hypothetical protein
MLGSVKPAVGIASIETNRATTPHRRAILSTLQFTREEQR